MSDPAARSAAWLDWMARVRGDLLRQPFGHAPDLREVRRFHAQHWTVHRPLHLRGAFAGPATRWTLDILRARVPPGLEVEVQAGRNADPDFERNCGDHVERMPWRSFLLMVEDGPDNEVYLTARNARSNGALMAALADDLRPLPPVVRDDPAAGFLWFGRGSLTPLHVDHTCNFLVQLMGVRLVRVAPPSAQPLVENDRFVFSRLRWLGEADAAARGISFTDHLLEPGDLLFLPVGWWHCVRAEGVSAMLSTTATWWPNRWTEGYPP